MIMGLMPILSRSYFEAVAFEETTLEPLLGSGPYRIERVEPGRSVVYRRDPDYWGRDLPVNRGQYNFDRIRFDYYRDADVMMEAFKAGEYDFRNEASAARLAGRIRFPGRGGRSGQGRTPRARPALRDARPRLQHPPRDLRGPHRPSCPCARVRLRVDQPGSAPWRIRPDAQHLRQLGARLARGAGRGRARPSGTFPGPPASRALRHGLPAAGGGERRSPQPPEGAAAACGGGGGRCRAAPSGAIRTGSRWRSRSSSCFRGTRRSRSRSPATSSVSASRPGCGRSTPPSTRIDATPTTSTCSSTTGDVAVTRERASVLLGTAAAGQEGARNYPGVRSPVVDALIGRMTHVRGREAFVDTVRAMDRVLLWGHYFVPLHHRNEDYVAYWDKLGRPEVTPPVRGRGGNLVGGPGEGGRPAAVARPIRDVEIATKVVDSEPDTRRPERCADRLAPREGLEPPT